MPKDFDGPLKFFPTCLVDALMPEVGLSMAGFFRSRGIAFETPASQVCCGQSLFKAGHVDSARRVAVSWVEAFSGAGAVVSPSGSCVAHVKKNFPDLLAKYPTLAKEAERLGAVTYEFSQYIWHVLGVRELGRVGVRGDFTYHPSCGLHRSLGENETPYRLLDSIKEARRVELPQAERCCGFGGPFAAQHEAISGILMEKKLKDVLSTGTETLVVGDVGCYMHLKGGAEKKGLSLKVIHLSEALAGMVDR